MDPDDTKEGSDLEAEWTAMRIALVSLSVLRSITIGYKTHSI